MSKSITVLILILSITASLHSEEIKEMDLTHTTYLIDDFSTLDGYSAAGSRWEGFTDRVMGGISRMQSGYETEGELHYLILKGDVSTANNGGFIQVRLRLNPDGTPFNAGSFQGIRLTTRLGPGHESEKGGGYYMHIRTPRTMFPWSYFVQEIPVSDSWREIDLPFTGFASENMLPAALNPRKLISLAIVGAKGDFQADIQVSRIEFY
jgi:hypothetical protein